MISSDPTWYGGTYLVERYLTAAAADGLPAAVRRLLTACSESGIADDRVRYLHSTYLPSEETCFCVFQASSPEAVFAVNEVAEFAIDRITDALVMYEAPPGSSL